MKIMYEKFKKAENFECFWKEIWKMSISKKVLLAIDVGNSMTKANWGTSVNTHQTMEQNNEFYVTGTDVLDTIDTSEIGSEDDLTTSETPTSVVFTLDSNNQNLKDFLDLPKRVFGGTDAVIQYEHTVIRPSQGSKADMETTYYSIFSILYRISNILGGVDELNVSLGVCLPLADVDMDKDSLESRLVGTHKLGNGEKTITINILKTYSVGECFASSISTLYTMNGKKKAKLDPSLTDGKYVVVNIGAGTTDVALFNNGKFVEGSKDTFQIGGNNVREMLITELYKKFRFRVALQSAETAIATGKVKVGSRYVKVLSTIDKVKRAFSVQLMDLVKRYLTQISQPLQELGAVLCVGGGALEGNYEDESGITPIESTASYINDYVLETSPFTKVIVHDNPRYADADGCWIILCVKEGA